MISLRNFSPVWFAPLLFIFLILASSPGFTAPGDQVEGTHKKEAVKAPLLSKKLQWIQGNADEGSFSKKITLVYFWDYTTINNIRELGYIRRWYDAYHSLGFHVVFIHTPEFPFAGEKENVLQAIERMEIPYPVILDSDGALWEKYGNRSWPTKYFVNSSGEIAYSQPGEGMYVAAELALRELLLKLDPATKLPDFSIKEDRDRFNLWECGDMNTELYLGFKRAAWWGIEIANRSGVFPNQILNYRDRGKRLERGFFLNGRWANSENHFEYMDQKEDYSDYLGFIYVGREVYGVLSNLEKRKNLRVYVERDESPIPEEIRGEDVQADEEGKTYLIVDQPRLYYLVKNEDDNYHELRLYAREKGLGVYVFSFSNSCLTDFKHL